MELTLTPSEISPSMRSGHGIPKTRLATISGFHRIDLPKRWIVIDRDDSITCDLKYGENRDRGRGRS